MDTTQAPPNAGAAAPIWKALTLDLSRYAGRNVTLRMYHWLVAEQLPGAAYWRSVRVE